VNAPPSHISGDTEPLCCGEHYPGEKGKPIILACQLCPKSATYWRRATNRSSGGKGSSENPERRGQQ
jgi:hypothetical protein